MKKQLNISKADFPGIRNVQRLAQLNILSLAISIFIHVYIGIHKDFGFLTYSSSLQINPLHPFRKLTTTEHNYALKMCPTLPNS